MFRNLHKISSNSVWYLRSWKRFLKKWLFYFTMLSILWLFRTVNSCFFHIQSKWRSGASHKDDNYFLKTLLVSVLSMPARTCYELCWHKNNDHARALLTTYAFKTLKIRDMSQLEKSLQFFFSRKRKWNQQTYNNTNILIG